MRAFRRGYTQLFDAALGAAAVTFALGLYLLAQPNPEAVTGATFANLDYLMPLRLWGVLFVAKGICALTALALQSWRGVAWVALIGGMLWTTWAATFVWTAVFNDWVGFIAACGFALAAFMHVLIVRSSAVASVA